MNQANTTQTTIKQFEGQIKNKTLGKSFRNSELSTNQKLQSSVFTHPKIQKGQLNQYQEYQVNELRKFEQINQISKKKKLCESHKQELIKYSKTKDFMKLSSPLLQIQQKNTSYQAKSPHDQNNQFKIINEEDIMNEDSQTSRRNIDRITQGFLFDSKSKTLKINKEINKEDVSHMNQLIVSMRQRLKNNKKDTINFEKQLNQDLQAHQLNQSQNHIISASNLGTIDMSSVDDEEKCQQCVQDKILIKKHHQDLIDQQVDLNQQKNQQMKNDNLKSEKNKINKVENLRNNEKQEIKDKSINTSISNTSFTYHDKQIYEVYEKKKTLSKEKLVNIHLPYQLTAQKTSLNNINLSKQNSKFNSPKYESSQNVQQSVSQPQIKIERSQRNQSNLFPQNLTSNFSYKNIIGSDNRHFQTIQNQKHFGLRQRSDDSIRLTAGRKSYISKQNDTESNDNKNEIFIINKDSKQIINTNLGGDVEIVQQHKKTIQNIKIQNSSQSLGRISIADLKQNLRKIRMKNSQLNNYEQTNEFDKKNSILQFEKNKNSESSVIYQIKNQSENKNRKNLDQSKYLNSSGLTFKVTQMEQKESTQSFNLPDIKQKQINKITQGQDYTNNEAKQDYTQFVYGHNNQFEKVQVNYKKHLKLPLKILEQVDKQNEQKTQTLNTYTGKQQKTSLKDLQSNKLVNGTSSNDITASDIYEFTQKFISSGKESRIQNQSENKIKVPSIKRQINQNELQKNKILPYSQHISAQKNDFTTQETELKTKLTDNLSNLEDTIQMSKSDTSKDLNYQKIQSKLGNSKIKVFNEVAIKDFSPYQNLNIVENQIDDNNYTGDKNYEQEQSQNNIKMISNFGTNLLQYNKIIQNSSDYNSQDQQILVKSQKLNILIKKKNNQLEENKSIRASHLNQSQVIQQSSLDESKLEIQENKKNQILNQIQLFKQNMKKNSISQMTKQEIIVQSRIIKAQQNKSKKTVKKKQKDIIKDIKNQYSNENQNQKPSNNSRVDPSKSNKEKSINYIKNQKINSKNIKQYSQKSFEKDNYQNVVKCDHCKKPKIKNQNFSKIKHQFQPSPLKYLNDSKALSISGNHQKNHSIEQNSNINKNKNNGDKTLLKSQDKRLSIESISGKSPNLIRFLERNNSKDRLLLTKAYNISLQNQIEFERKNSPSNRYFRLYVQDQEENVNEDSLSEQKKNLKKLKISQKQHPLSPKTSRRMINALQPCYRQGNERFQSRKEIEKKKIEQQIEQNTPEQNFQLFVINEGARQIILKRQDVCNCSQQHRNRMIDRSVSIHSVNSVRTAIINRMRRRNKKKGYSEINESVGEQQTDEAVDENNRRNRLGNNKIHNQHQPCRKTCSTIHNPMFHPWKQGRVQSADQLRKKKRQELLKIDWQKTLMYKHINTSSNLTKYIDITKDEKIHKIAQNKMEDDQNDGLFKDEHMKRKINLKNQKLTSIFQNREQQVAKQIEKLDLKQLHAQIDYELLNEQKKQKIKIYSSKEIDYFYSLVKQEDMVDRDEEFVKQLIQKSQNTLQMLMSSLMLKNEYDIILASYQSKLNFKNNKIIDQKSQKQIQFEIIKKILLRCRNFYEAKYEIVRILVKTTKRESLINQFEQELQDGKLEYSKAKLYYQAILKISCRIFNQIEKIRVDNPMLNRPFIYQQSNLQTHMIKQILNIRTNLKNKYQELLLKTELDQILDKTGKIIKISELSQLNRELDSQDPFGSSLFEKDIIQSGRGFNRKKSKNEQSPNKREYDLDQRKIFIGLIRQKDGKMQSQRVQLLKQQENIVNNLLNTKYEVNSSNSQKINKNILK